MHPSNRNQKHKSGKRPKKLRDVQNSPTAQTPKLHPLSQSERIRIDEEEMKVLLKLLYNLRIHSETPYKKNVEDNAAEDSDEDTAMNDRRRGHHLKKESRKLLKELLTEDRKEAADAITIEQRLAALSRSKDTLPVSEKNFDHDFVQTQKSTGKTVRLMVEAEGVAGKSKLLVIPREDNLNELFVSAKNKLKLKKMPIEAWIPKKKNEVVLLRDTMNVPDGSAVVVSFCPRNVIPSAPASPAAAPNLLSNASEHPSSLPQSEPAVLEAAEPGGGSPRLEREGGLPRATRPAPRRTSDPNALQGQR